MEETMAMKSLEEKVDLVRKNIELVQENKRLRAENAAMKKQMADMQLLLKNERYLANRYRELRKERCQVQGWLNRVWKGMDEAWAVRVIIGTMVMSLLALGLAELFPKILY
jgi:regulator of replication initiation timing